MTAQPQPKDSQAAAARAEALRTVANRGQTAQAGVGEPNGEIGEPTPVSRLSPEEQMVLFEKELKDKDWGHQPC